MNKSKIEAGKLEQKQNSEPNADDLQVCQTCAKPNFSSRYRYYKGYTIRNHGYYPPDKCVWWEAINDETGCGDFHAHRLRDIIKMIDESLTVTNGC